eukprot:131836-Pyramimonas_sp.AAC.1
MHRRCAAILRPHPPSRSDSHSLCFFRFRAWLFRRMIQDGPELSPPRKSAHVRAIPSIYPIQEAWAHL